MSKAKVKIYSDDTIVAISTLVGEAGIGIVRLSGPSAIDISSKIFKPKSKKNISELPSFTTHLGKIVENEQLVDEVLLTIMRSPKSYTREDVVEISCHGGFLTLKKTLELCIKYGARLAEPGEFTKRAFLNGRIDLSQAEAVCDIIKAKTDIALSCALQQLNGALSQKINEQKSKVVDTLATLEVAIDCAEDEIPVLEGSELTKKIVEIEDGLEKMLSTFLTGKIFREGVRCAIVGKPNVGKSSLLNLLAGQDRAIVTEIPGTTRDIIEETVSIYGIPLILIDTAGIRRHSQDIVEQIGIEKAQERLKTADLVLFVLDSSQGLSSEDFHIAELVISKKAILVLNKSDLATSPFSPLPTQKIGDISQLGIVAPAVSISALKNEGIDELKRVIYESFISNGISTSEFFLSNTRHKILVENAINSLEKARDSITAGLSEEFIALDLRAALNYLGQITGEVPTEQILDRIFSNFCVGK
ncbi:MAG: tRNA uridine-5-carboxymethylaminomethyl(34) synthesis GTPase MnmE [Elusimicrobiota bacterium]